MTSIEMLLSLDIIIYLQHALITVYFASSLIYCICSIICRILGFNQRDATNWQATVILLPHELVFDVCIVLTASRSVAP